MQPTGARPLAPAPSPPTRQEDSPDTASLVHGQPAATGIRRASTACQSCKQIKRKCDQAQPCSNCRKSNTRCVYNEAEDGRRKAARKRTVESLELKRDALDNILDSFRTSTDGQAQHLLQLIREDAPLEQIVQYATIHRGTLPQRQLDDIVSQINEQPRKSVMSVTALCDTPLFQLSAKPWTAVTSNDELVSHLISIFFTWYYPAYPTLDKDLFLRDMAAGSLECQFCSPLLINAMLALACNFSDHPLTCRIPLDGSTRGQHFLNEAVQLWAAEEAVPSLVNVQAASILAVASCLVGKDRLSWSYIEQMNEMNDSLSLKHVQAQTWGLSPASSETVHAEALTSETAFLLTVGYGIAFMKPSNNPAQVHQQCSIADTDQDTIWIPYPQQFPEITYEFNQLREAFCEIHKIGLEIQTLLFGSSADNEISEISLLDEKLVSWKASLPAHLQVDFSTSVVKPPVVNLHLTYHFLRLTLFSFPDTNHSRSVSEPARVTSGQLPASTTMPTRTVSRDHHTTFTTAERVSASPLPGDQAQSLSHFQSKALNSAKDIALLSRLYTRDFGLKQPCMWMPQAAASAAYCLINLPILLTDPTVSGIFHEVCSVLTAASRRWLVMKGHVRMLFMTADLKGQKMLPETRQLLQFIALDQWAENDHKIFASSVYPNYALAKDGADPRLSGMGDLLEMWAGIKIKNEIDTQEDTFDSSAEGTPSSKFGTQSERQSGS